MCNCIEEVNKKLKEKGVRLQSMWAINMLEPDISTTLFCPTEKIETSKPAKLKVFFSYCPFCGEKYECPQTF